MASSPITALASLSLLLGLLAATAVAAGVARSTDDGQSNAKPLSNPGSCPQVLLSERVDCFPEGYADLSEANCNLRGCCWNETTAAVVGTSGQNQGRGKDGVPVCFYPAQFGYTLENVVVTPTSISGDLNMFSSYQGPYGPNIEQLSLSVHSLSSSILRIRIADPNNARYEVPINVPQTDVHMDGSPVQYAIDHTESPEPFGLRVRRAATNESVLDTINFGGLVFEDQFLQLSTKVASANGYGLGEHVAPFLLSYDWNTLTMFARDQGTPAGYTNLYGTHPLLVTVERSGMANGIFFFNSNAMDIALQPTPAATFRSIGGVLDFFVFLGPSINEVVQQYTAVIGRPFMPPYWALGFHLCRWGYNSANNTVAVVDAMRAAGIPQDVQWNDIDYMRNHLDFTFDPAAYAGLPALVDDLHAHHQHYIMIVDPGISNAQAPGTYAPFDEGIQQGVFIKNASGQPLIGSVWPGTTAFPDFLNPAAASYWYDQVQAFHSQVPFDGLWIDMNEISNFVQGSTVGCPQSSYEKPPYIPHIADNELISKTICMTATHYGNQLEYNVHSLYGYTEAKATMAALQKVLGARSLVISRSTFANSGAYGGHWLGDNVSEWADLIASIAGILNFNLFGIPMVGADICGFGGTANAELCARWMQLGSFYPFSRNHNTIGKAAQDPTAFGEQVAQISRAALLTRYSLLPFLYSLFYLSSTLGLPVARSLVSEFPQDSTTYNIDRQFLWGDCLLITPVLTAGGLSVQGYFPVGNWYDWRTGAALPSPAAGRWLTLAAPLDIIPVHVRGGAIIPTQAPATTTYIARQNLFSLTVALGDGVANGFMYTDDGESLDSISSGAYTYLWFNATATADGTSGTVKSTIVTRGYQTIPALSSLRVLGVSKCPQTVTLNSANVPFTCDTVNNVLTASSFNQSLITQFAFAWS